MFTDEADRRQAFPSVHRAVAHTGALNAQVEEVFTGHADREGVRPQREVEERFRADNDQLYEASFGAQFISGSSSRR
jgi:hypothetical protein